MSVYKDVVDAVKTIFEADGTLAAAVTTFLTLERDNDIDFDSDTGYFTNEQIPGMYIIAIKNESEVERVTSFKYDYTIQVTCTTFAKDQDNTTSQTALDAIIERAEIVIRDRCSSTSSWDTGIYTHDGPVSTIEYHEYDNHTYGIAKTEFTIFTQVNT